MPLASYREWRQHFQCSHGHCPCGCDHPQPFIDDGILYCGACLVRAGEYCQMTPCRPPYCEEA